MQRLSFRAVLGTVATTTALTVAASLLPRRAADAAPQAASAAGLAVIDVTKDVIELGRENWEHPWLPDLKHPGQKIALTDDQRIDIVILCDGFLPSERAAFEAAAKDWYARFLRLTPYSEMRGAFRVRAVWTPSAERCSLPAEKGKTVGTFYHIRAAKAVPVTNGLPTRTALFRVLDQVGINGRQQDPNRPTELTHAYFAMLVLNQDGKEPSGIEYGINSPDGKRNVRGGIGESFIHEFNHAYGHVTDEYMRSGIAADPKTPGHVRASIPSIFTLTNLTYSKDLAKIPWMHYAPGSYLNPDAGSVIGLLWQGGGGAETNVWHSQPKCMENGTAGNWNLDKTARGGQLRDMKNLCFWCQELVVARTYLHADQLGDAKTVSGEDLWKIWANDFRPAYAGFFHVKDAIRERNAEYAEEKMAAAKLYERPAAATATAAAAAH